jgi:peptidoglycan/xylan/chitin deacetylase (PgdA/CDA1 family)
LFFRLCDSTANICENAARAKLNVLFQAAVQIAFPTAKFSPLFIYWHHCMRQIFIPHINNFGQLRKLLMFLTIIGVVFLALRCPALSLIRAAAAAEQLTNQVPIRFLLSFDDGPAASGATSPTLSILDDLAHNPLQPGIKVIFFLQTRASRAGGSVLGRQIMGREYSEGHVLAFHTATAEHSNHRNLDPAEFEQSLNDGIADIRSITGAAPSLVRPPFWSYDRRTFGAYQMHGLHMVLTDMSANDGKIWGVDFSLRRRSSMLHQLSDVQKQIAVGALPLIDGNIPVIVTFHDINRYTARHMQEYLEILTSSGHELGMPIAAKAFYDDRAELERAAIGRSISSASQRVRLPGLWNWIWH